MRLVFVNVFQPSIASFQDHMFLEASGDVKGGGSKWSGRCTKPLGVHVRTVLASLLNSSSVTEHFPN